MSAFEILNAIREGRDPWLEAYKAELEAVLDAAQERRENERN